MLARCNVLEVCKRVDACLLDLYMISLQSLGDAGATTRKSAAAGCMIVLPELPPLWLEHKTINSSP